VAKIAKLLHRPEGRSVIRGLSEKLYFWYIGPTQAHLQNIWVKLEYHSHGAKVKVTEA